MAIYKLDMKIFSRAGFDRRKKRERNRDYDYGL
jgi:hypothetical protein